MPIIWSSPEEGIHEERISIEEVMQVWEQASIHSNKEEDFSAYFENLSVEAKSSEDEEQEVG